MVQGGTISFESPYILRTIASLQDKVDDIESLLTATSIAGTSGSDDSLGGAVILTNKEIAKPAKEINSIADLANIIKKENSVIVGVSWYAAAKIMEELKANNGKTKANEISNYVCIVGNVDDTKPSNTSNKIALIAFVHGIHAYAIVSGYVGAVGAVVDTFKSKYDFVVKYISDIQQADIKKAKEKGYIEGIWRSLLEQYGIAGIESDTLSDIINKLDYKNVQTMYTDVGPSAPQEENPSPSASGIQKAPSENPLNTVFEIPAKFPIHEVLVKTK